MNKKTLLSIIFLLIPFALFAEEKIRVAVMPFNAGSGVSKPEANYLTDRVRTGLIKSGKFDVISNDQIKAMMKVKQAKQTTGSGSCTSEKCMIDLGNALECEKMIVGSAAGAFGEFAISIKMLDVVKQKYDIAEEIAIDSKKKFPNAARRIVKLLLGKGISTQVDTIEKEDTTPPGPVTYTGLLWRSFVIPGWGHLYTNQSRGYIYGGLFMTTGGLFLWSHLNYSGKQSNYDNAKTGDDFSSLYDDANSASSFRGLMSLVFLATYIVVLGDVIFTGGSAVASAQAMNYPDNKEDPFSFAVYAGSYSNSPESLLTRPENRLDFSFSYRY